MVLVKLINHACFSIEREESLTLMDPWFFGRIFNNSWSLIRETELSSISGIDKLKHIVISHEHPDHLHWPTLRSIRDYSDNEITVYMPYRSNENVRLEIEKIGFKFEYLLPKTPYEIENDFSISSFPTGHDAAIVFDVEGRVLLNQNDAYLTEAQCYELSGTFPEIDSWWMQFSLAGYYANKNNPEEIMEKGHRFHLREFKKYKDFFKPKVSVPFASFCYFCKYFNSYLNEYAVTPSTLNDYCNSEIQILCYGDKMAWDHSRTNEETSLQWKEIYKSERIVDPYPKKIDEEELLSNGQKLFSSSSYNKKTSPSALFELYDYNDHLLSIDFANEEIQLKKSEDCDPSMIAGSTSSDEINSYLKFPWGADTLNITAAFEIHNENLWSNMLIFRDRLYVR
jgi:UDP-MurNAc hydroxylase